MRSNKFSKLLLVEGNDDKHVLYALCKHFNIKHNFDVIDCKGIESLLLQIPVRFKQSGVDTIGIIVDADLDLSSRWQQIHGILKNIFPNLPIKLPEEGLIFKNEDFSVGVWLMPNNTIPGMLEDFIKFLIPNEDQLFSEIKEFLNQLEEKEINQYKKIHRSKAEIHSWLAIQSDPGTPLGLSITKRYLTIEKEECKNLVNWLIQLFA